MKNNIVVKIISLLLISAMVFSGCAKKSGDQSVTTNDTGVSSDTQSESENKELDPYTIDWYFVGSGPQPDTEAVEEKINELL